MAKKTKAKRPVTDLSPESLKKIKTEASEPTAIVKKTEAKATKGERKRLAPEVRERLYNLIHERVGRGESVRAIASKLAEKSNGKYQAQQLVSLYYVMAKAVAKPAKTSTAKGKRGRPRKITNAPIEANGSLANGHDTMTVVDSRAQLIDLFNSINTELSKVPVTVRDRALRALASLHL